MSPGSQDDLKEEDNVTPKRGKAIILSRAWGPWPEEV